MVDEQYQAKEIFDKRRSTSEGGMPKVGWGAVVLGDTTDLEGWAYALKEQFEPWVEAHGTDTVLRSASLDELDSAIEVRDRSTTLIERLNGAMALSRGSKPVRFGGVIRFTPDGRLHRTIFAEMFVEETPDEVHIIAVVSGPDGKPLPPPPPRPSEVQHWSALADNDDLLNDALIYFGRATDWFDIYKTLECLEKFGGREKQFLTLNWADEDEIKLLKRTANWGARHARHKFQRPPKPMKLPEARRLVSQLLKRALEETAGPRG